MRSEFEAIPEAYRLQRSREMLTPRWSGPDSNSRFRLFGGMAADFFKFAFSGGSQRPGSLVRMLGKLVCELSRRGTASSNPVRSATQSCSCSETRVHGFSGGPRPAEKKRGALGPDYLMPVLGGMITKW